VLKEFDAAFACILASSHPDKPQTSLDCNLNRIPDGCDISAETELDCDNSGVPDSCEIVNNSSLDCDSSSLLLYITEKN
jgi:hypothetical protein